MTKQRRLDSVKGYIQTGRPGAYVVKSAEGRRLTMFTPNYEKLFHAERERADRLQRELDGAVYILLEAVRQCGGRLEVPKRALLEDAPSVRHEGVDYAEVPGVPLKTILVREETPNNPDTIIFKVREPEPTT